MARNSRPLVTGFLEGISVKAFDSYHGDITELVRAKHGVYALYKNDRLYYVGLASNLRRRIKQHMKDRHSKKWNRFSLYLVRKVDHIKEIESILLRIASPRGNKQVGKLRGASNLKAQLRQMMKNRSAAEIDELLVRGRSKRGRTTPTKKRGGSRRVSSRAEAYPLRGLLKNKRIYGTHKGWEYRAYVLASGRIKFDGEFYETPTTAAKAIVKHAVNGWAFWYIRKGSECVKLRELR